MLHPWLPSNGTFGARNIERPLRFYWVEFDEPQTDADGDRPYFGVEIDSAFLSVKCCLYDVSS
jgi:hypothetical protein